MNRRETVASHAKQVVRRGRRDGVVTTDSFVDVRFTVPGNPVPKERPRVVRGRTFTPKRTLDAEKKIAWYGAQAMSGRKPVECSVSIHLTFFRADKRRYDWDNAAKTVCDALNGVCWKDDSQIVMAVVFKDVDAARPRTEIMVRRLA